MYEESSIPYFFDITHYESISNSDLKEHIDTWAREIQKIIGMFNPPIPPPNSKSPYKNPQNPPNDD